MYLIWLLLILTLNKSNCQNRDEKPIIEDLFTSSKLVENKKFSITCQANKGPVQFEWLLNNQPIVLDGNKVFTLNNDESSMLNIKQMNLDHAGEYTCKIKNSGNQEDSRTISVKLNGKLN